MIIYYKIKGEGFLEVDDISQEDHDRILQWIKDNPTASSDALHNEFSELDLDWDIVEGIQDIRNSKGETIVEVHNGGKVVYQTFDDTHEDRKLDNTPDEFYSKLLHYCLNQFCGIAFPLDFTLEQQDEEIEKHFDDFIDYDSPYISVAEDYENWDRSYILENAESLAENMIRFMRFAKKENWL